MPVQVRNEFGSEAYDALISPHLSVLKRWVISRTPKGLSSDDIVQQTLVLALRNISTLRTKASAGTWLCTIALNVIRGHMRSPQNSRTVCLDAPASGVPDIRDPRPSALDFIEREEATVFLHRMIAMLPERYRIVVELLDLQGCSTDEIMNALSISKTALKSRHFRARRMLLEFLTKGKTKPRAQSA